MPVAAACGGIDLRDTLSKSDCVGRKLTTLISKRVIIKMLK